ncbi:MAG TPA: hypothetical protein VMF11_11600 [Candidatus Baltobacteraceae bacterium]|nr:hypothetical protein [Candidatus Baltobacteraceae bacterium]
MERHERGKVHIVEPQDLFVPTLVDVFSEAGLFVDRVSEQIDPQILLEEQPDLLFVDSDYLDDPLRAVRLARTLAAHAFIVIYSNSRGGGSEDAFLAAGAAVVLDKSAERESIVETLRATWSLRHT